MKKIVILFSILFFLNFNGNSQSVEMKNILKYFEETELPVSSKEITYNNNAKRLSENDKLFFSYYKNEIVYAYYYFDVYQDYTAFLYIVKKNEIDKGKLMLIFFDNYGNMTSQLELDYDVASGLGFKINPDFVIQKSVFEQGMGGMYENNGTDCAIYMRYSDPKETFTDMCKIQDDGDYTFFSKYISTFKVKQFIELLSDKNFYAAYYSQKNPKWGSLEHFSSTKAFGGINFIAVNEIKYVSGNENKAIIYCDAIYYDNTNGDSDIKQNFTVSKISGNWYITDMKIVSFKKRRNYVDTNGELEYLDISLTNFTDSTFHFYIEAVSFDECEECEGNPYVYISGTAIYTDYNQAIFTDGKCSLYFFFTDEDKELTLTAYQYDGLYKNLNLILGYSFYIRTL